MKVDREAIYQRDAGTCGFCGQPVPWELLHIDHIQPRALGGPTTPENLRVAHRRCNLSAGASVGRERRRLGLPPVPYSYDRIALTIPIELAERLRKLAERERRPLSSQVQLLIERGLELERTSA